MPPRYILPHAASFKVKSSNKSMFSHGDLNAYFHEPHMGQREFNAEYV